MNFLVYFFEPAFFQSPDFIVFQTKSPNQSYPRELLFWYRMRCFFNPVVIPLREYWSIDGAICLLGSPFGPNPVFSLHVLFFSRRLQGQFFAGPTPNLQVFCHAHFTETIEYFLLPTRFLNSHGPSVRNSPVYPVFFARALFLLFPFPCRRRPYSCRGGQSFFFWS